MTVDEAIAKLQEISAQGNGGLHLAFYVSPERKVVWYQTVGQIDIVDYCVKDNNQYVCSEGDGNTPTPFVRLDY